MGKNITLTKADDFLKYLHSAFPRNFVKDGETIPENSCSYSDTFKAFRINDASLVQKGSLQIYLGELSIGDKVDINVEVMNISGVKAKIAIDYVPSPTRTDAVANLFILQSKKTGEFERIGGSFLSTRNGHAMAVIGVFTGDIGDFYIRNVDIKAKSKKSTLKSYLVAHLFTNSQGNFMLNNTRDNDKATLTVENNNTLVVNFEEKITHGANKLIPFVSEDFYGPSGQYIVRCGEATDKSIKLRFYHINDPSTAVNISDIPLGFYVSVLGVTKIIL